MILDVGKTEATANENLLAHIRPRVIYDGLQGRGQHNPLAVERPPRVLGVRAELLLNAVRVSVCWAWGLPQNLVVLGQALRAARGTCLDLAGAKSNHLPVRDGKNKALKEVACVVCV